jgi:uncharacterized LabA/DUF88 family protein
VVDRLLRKTGVYVDGYNLYYGRLRGSAYKWLDLVKLIEGILSRRDQNESLECVHLFTAPALANFASHGEASVQAQSSYHRALKAAHGDRVVVTYGRHSYDPNGSLVPEFVKGQPYDRTKRVRVWRLEEKKTDVNLAVSMYRHAGKGLYDRIILVSNDSDAEPVLEAIREDFPHITIGVVIPIRPVKTGEPERRVSGSLTKHAHWVIRHLSDAELGDAQLREVVPTKKKAIKKPAHW